MNAKRLLALFLSMLMVFSVISFAGCQNPTEPEAPEEPDTPDTPDTPDQPQEEGLEVSSGEVDMVIDHDSPAWWR